MYLERLLVFTSFFITHITGSALHGPCSTDDDCGTIDTYCKNETCFCKENFVVWIDSCLPVTNPIVSCMKKHECHPHLGTRSVCTKKQVCACKPFHHLHMGQCVKNKDLDDICEHDHQCYCGAGCEDKIACIDKKCNCKPGNMPYRIRRCIHDPTYIKVEMLPSQSPITIFNANSSLVSSSTTVLTRSSAMIILATLMLLVPI